MFDYCCFINNNFLDLTVLQVAPTELFLVYVWVFYRQSYSYGVLKAGVFNDFLINASIVSHHHTNHLIRKINGSDNFSSIGATSYVVSQ